MVVVRRSASKVLGPFFGRSPEIWCLMGVMIPGLGTIPAFEAHCLGNTKDGALSEILVQRGWRPAFLPSTSVCALDSFDDRHMPWVYDIEPSK